MARDRLRKLIAGQGAAQPLLPYVHTTDAYQLLGALDDGRLTAPPCQVFVGEPLIYFFYGRPSYRVNANEKPTSLNHYLPVCLIFKANNVLPIKRIFPFDTGGFRGEFYSDAIHRKMKLDDFELEPDPLTPGRVVSLFFGSVASYLDAKALPSVSLDAVEMEAISYHALISQRLSNSPDNRISGVEIQIEGDIDLAGAVEAVVLPGPLFDSPIIKSMLKKYKICPLIYNQIDRQKPSDYVSKIFDLCFDYYSQIEIKTSK